MSDKEGLNQYYQEVPRESLQKYKGFLSQYPYQTFQFQRQTWNYIDTGKGKRSLLLLAGGTGAADISFQTITHLAREYRVIAPDYPPLNTIKELFDGLQALLANLNIETFFLMGGSYGGIMAHSLVRMFKERVEKVVITAAGPPNPENSKQLRRMMPLFRFMPLGILKRMLTKSFQNLVAESDNPDMHMLWGITRKVIRERIKRADLVALTNRLIDQTDHYSFNAQDLADWQGEMLFILGGKDPSTSPEKIERLRELYQRRKFRLSRMGRTQ